MHTFKARKIAKIIRSMAARMSHTGPGAVYLGRASGPELKTVDLLNTVRDEIGDVPYSFRPWIIQHPVSGDVYIPFIAFGHTDLQSWQAFCESIKVMMEEGKIFDGLPDAKQSILEQIEKDRIEHEKAAGYAFPKYL